MKVNSYWNLKMEPTGQNCWSHPIQTQLLDEQLTCNYQMSFWRSWEKKVEMMSGFTQMSFNNICFHHWKNEAGLAQHAPLSCTMLFYYMV